MSNRFLRVGSSSKRAAENARYAGETLPTPAENNLFHTSTVRARGVERQHTHLSECCAALRAEWGCGGSERLASPGSGAEPQGVPCSLSGGRGRAGGRRRACAGGGGARRGPGPGRVALAAGGALTSLELATELGRGWGEGRFRISNVTRSRGERCERCTVAGFCTWGRSRPVGLVAWPGATEDGSRLGVSEAPVVGVEASVGLVGHSTHQTEEVRSVLSMVGGSGVSGSAESCMWTLALTPMRARVAAVCFGRRRTSHRRVVPQTRLVRLLRRLGVRAGRCAATALRTG